MDPNSQLYRRLFTFQPTFTIQKAEKVYILGTFGENDTDHWKPIEMSILDSHSSKIPASASSDEKANLKPIYGVKIENLVLDKKYLYKFKSGENWAVERTAPIERSIEGFENNVFVTQSEFCEKMEHIFQTPIEATLEATNNTELSDAKESRSLQVSENNNTLDAQEMLSLGSTGEKSETLEGGKAQNQPEHIFEPAKRTEHTESLQQTDKKEIQNNRDVIANVPEQTDNNEAHKEINDTALLSENMYNDKITDPSQQLGSNPELDLKEPKHFSERNVLSNEKPVSEQNGFIATGSEAQKHSEPEPVEVQPIHKAFEKGTVEELLAQNHEPAHNMLGDPNVAEKANVDDSEHVNEEFFDTSGNLVTNDTEKREPPDNRQEKDILIDKKHEGGNKRSANVNVPTTGATELNSAQINNDTVLDIYAKDGSASKARKSKLFISSDKATPESMLPEYENKYPVPTSPTVSTTNLVATFSPSPGEVNANPVGDFVTTSIHSSDDPTHSNKAHSASNPSDIESIHKSPVSRSSSGSAGKDRPFSGALNNLNKILSSSHQKSDKDLILETDPNFVSISDIKHAQISDANQTEAAHGSVLSRQSNQLSTKPQEHSSKENILSAISKNQHIDNSKAQVNQLTTPNKPRTVSSNASVADSEPSSAINSKTDTKSPKLKNRFSKIRSGILPKKSADNVAEVDASRAFIDLEASSRSNHSSNSANKGTMEALEVNKNGESSKKSPKKARGIGSIFRKLF